MLLSKLKNLFSKKHSDTDENNPYAVFYVLEKRLILLDEKLDKIIKSLDKPKEVKKKKVIKPKT